MIRLPAPSRLFWMALTALALSQSVGALLALIP